MAREVTFRVQRPPWGTHVASETRSLNLAELLRRSVFTQTGRVSFDGSLLAMSRLLFGIGGIWYGPLCIRASVFTWSDSIRKGFAEDLGLLMATVAAGDYGWDGLGPQWADHQRQYWGSSDNRPDLVFTIAGTDGCQVAAEAKGRLIRAKAPLVPPTAEQSGWLTEMENWALDVPSQWFLLSLWASEIELVADLFDPGEASRLLPSAIIEAAVRDREDAVFLSSNQSGPTLAGGVRSGSASVRIPGNQESDDPTTLLTLVALETPLLEPIEVVTESMQVGGSGRIVVVLSSGETEVDIREVLIGEADNPPPYHVGAILLLGDAAEGPWGGGYETDEGQFVVVAARVNEHPFGSFGEKDWELRDELIATGRLVPHAPGKFPGLLGLTGYTFNSPSHAARFILGRQASGPAEWKYGGLPLRHIDRR